MRWKEKICVNLKRRKVIIIKNLIIAKIILKIIIQLKLDLYLTVSFGELELSNLTFWSLVGITLLFVISFVLSTIPLTKNIQDTKKYFFKKIKFKQPPYILKNLY